MFHHAIRVRRTLVHVPVEVFRELKRSIPFGGGYNGRMITANPPTHEGPNRRVAALAFVLCGWTALSGCDRMKNLIDPSGNGYRKEATPAKEPPAGGGAPTPVPVSAPAPPTRAPNEPVHGQTAAGRVLTKSDIDSQLASIDFGIDRKTFRLVRGIHRDRDGITTVRDAAGKYWGEAIGDLNMDGSDDAVLLLRTDKAEGAVVWDLAYLPNREGRLHNVQTVRLPGDLGFGEVVIEGSGVLLTPVHDGPNVHLGYIGGELVLSP